MMELYCAEHQRTYREDEDCVDCLARIRFNPDARHLWIDDVRLPPDDTWLWAKNSRQAIAMLDAEIIDYIAFDFDLGGDDTALPVLHKIEEEAYNGKKPPRWNAHTANPVGRNHIETIMSKALELWHDTKR